MVISCGHTLKKLIFLLRLNKRNEFFCNNCYGNGILLMRCMVLLYIQQSLRKEVLSARVKFASWPVYHA